jgi:energy-coupling factor transport system ATP-binding protein
MGPRPETWMQLQDVSVHAGPRGSQGVRALDGVTLDVRTDTCVGLMGASGSGKSTLLHVLCRLIKPTRGRVVGAHTMPSLVFQFPENQLFSETVAADVGYGLRESGVAAEEIDGRVDAALEAVGLAPTIFRERLPFHLSGGERRRVALAGALAQQRSLLLLDEPTLALDVQGVRQLQKVLMRLRESGTRYWIASHDAEFLATTCSDLVVLQEGRVAYQGAAEPFWADHERAARLGVRVPHSARLRKDLEARGVAGLSPYPQENELVGALRQLRDRRR